MCIYVVSYDIAIYVQFMYELTQTYFARIKDIICCSEQPCKYNDRVHCSQIFCSVSGSDRVRDIARTLNETATKHEHTDKHD